MARRHSTTEKNGCMVCGLPEFAILDLGPAGQTPEEEAASVAAYGAGGGV